MKAAIKLLLDGLLPRLERMTVWQFCLLNLIIDTFDQPVLSTHDAKSDIATQEFLVAFGDFLKLHHSLSAAYLDKTRFELALERILSALKRKVSRPGSRTHRGHDLTVDGIRWSVKTHGDHRIKADSFFISKFMELGKGRWGKTNLEDLAGLRDQFLRHLDGYERIFQLRYFHLAATDAMPEVHRYELVEIPKMLLLEAAGGRLAWSVRSKTTPRCGYCTVTDQHDQVKFRLYFDGAGERKLQIKDLRKDLCIVHATWEFSSKTPMAIPNVS